jgi:hypothetical protein
MTLSVQLGIKSLSFAASAHSENEYFTYRGLRTNWRIFDLDHKIIYLLFITYIQITSNMAEIRTKHLQNTSQKNYFCCLCHTNFMSI